MSQEQTIRGIGRVHHGQRSLGCVGYALHLGPAGQGLVVKFDPMPDGARGDVFNLTLEDGRVLECQAVGDSEYLAVVGGGPRIERRQRRRPSPSARALS
jgi:hypothetical protein